MSHTLKSPGWAYRGGVLVRAVAAIGAGYGVSALWAAAIATWLPSAKVEAALTGTMIAFVIYPCAVMWCFAARSAARAWVGLALVALPAGAALALHASLNGGIA